jgi:hypothetical protein
MVLHPPKCLVKLPALYFDKRPYGMPLSTHEVISALWTNSGNVTLAAEQLRIGSARMRRIVHRFPEVKAAWVEIQEQLLDQAERVVREGLNDRNDPKRRLGMAKFVLNSERGRNRGWGGSVGTAGARRAAEHTVSSGAPNPQGGSEFPRLVWSDGRSLTE